MGIASDPVELLDESLDKTWRMVCGSFEVSTNLPDLQILFDGADISLPERAAQTILVNMLFEVMECVGRFSPWYRLPARAYGLTSVRNNTTNCVHWILAPEAVDKWEDILKLLSMAIEKNRGLIQAMVLVDSLMMRSMPDDPSVFASCQCTPPRTIRILRSMLNKGDILCDACRQPFCHNDEHHQMVLEDLRREKRNRIISKLKKPMTVRQLIESGYEPVPVSVPVTSTVFNALKLMSEKNLGAVIVVDERGKMVGIFTERDYARKIILMGRSSLDTCIREIMTQDMVTINPVNTLEEGLMLMTRHYIRHLPVMEADKLVGIISMRDIMTALIDQRDTAIDKLESYILGYENI